MQKVPKDISKLREGFTTGACSAAAAKAAAQTLLSQKKISEIEITLPIGRLVTFKLKRCELHSDYAICSVIKDAGDDPDCTDKAELTAKVTLNKTGEIHIFGGQGVAMVTRKGLGLEVGKHAINPVPRKNIIKMVKEVIDLSEFNGAEIEISVPGGEEMAKKTTNERLGLLGGISILGTTGIVKPYSTAAFKASVIQSVDIAKENKVDTIVLTTGGKSELYAMKLFPQLNSMSFIQVGDFIGISLKRAVRNKLKQIIIVGMMGKLSKMADGKMMTHVAGSKVNMEMLANIAIECGASDEIAEQMRETTMARRVLEICEENNIKGVESLICQKVVENCSEYIKDAIKINTYLIGFDGALLGQKQMEKIL